MKIGSIGEIKLENCRMDNLRQLFATPLLQSYLAVPSKILEFVKSQEFTYHGNGYITNENFLECSEMKTVKDFIT